jgi:hypothetical protein
VFKADLGHYLSNSEKQLVTSLTSGGAFVGALVAALAADAVTLTPSLQEIIHGH